jgi:hypothetical protein
MAFKFSEPSLRLLLHENKVCGELHILGDKFKQPFSPETTGGTSIRDNVRAFFSRSTNMHHAIEGLFEGEISYLRDISDFLSEVRDQATEATSLPEDKLIDAGESLIAQMKDKRNILQRQAREIQDAAYGSIAKLH